MEDEESASANLCRYFDSSKPTIFDEIVSSNNPDIFTMNTTTFNLPSGTPSGNIFENDSPFEDQSSEHISINDFHRDAWIPSDNTRKTLRAIATSAHGGNHLDRENLTMPGLALDEEMSDPIKEAVTYFLGEEETLNRTVSTLSDVTQDERGLRSLIKEKCYRAAINLSGRLLAVYGQGYGRINHPSKHTPHSLQLWFTRLALLTKLKQTEILETESTPFHNLDKPDMYFIFYPELYGTRPGSMASFAFRLLLAEIPMYCGKGKRAIDNLYAVLATIKKIIRNLESGLSEEGGIAKFNKEEKDNSIRLWKTRKCRTLVSIVNCAFSIKNYVLTREVLEQLLNSSEWKKSQIEILNSAIGRLYLSLGDVTAAEKQFTMLDRDNKKNDIKELVNKGLMAVAQNTFQEALNYFKAALEFDPSNVMLLNNIAVCLLYIGKLEAAIELMENMVTVQNPAKSLQEVVLSNICILYELHTAHIKQSKLNLLKQLNRYNGDASSIHCLKLTM
ncbi:PREDICTED: trafficking protein particle complex subunit 12 [Ceratosolen solmsi marchali]|uniref:Trafficking protein particle complex subunit 12 n=1 Tax=Ceratosolen solmsi marchali TaxID=326594 RepID=A0AAJ7DXA4_9HYME|nr:PREDICTED: trafficking protein particle complex subunit 12 [Ceratosolen solmsi marchali]